MTQLDSICVFLDNLDATLIPMTNSKDYSTELGHFDRSAVLVGRLARLSDDLATLHPQIAEAIAKKSLDEDFQIKHVERLAVLGTLEASLGHEIKNALAAALLNAENASKVKDDAKLLRESLDSITTAIRRCQRTVENVLRYSKRQFSERGLHDLNELVDRAVNLIEHYLEREKSVINVHLADDLPRLTVNAVEIEQVLVNLICNAVQAGDCTAITVSTDKRDDTIRIRVHDNGRGIPEANLQHIFDPFVTSRPSDESTGLGLAITRRIVEDHHGSIEVESQVGQGSTFTVILPLNSP